MASSQHCRYDSQPSISRSQPDVADESKIAIRRRLPCTMPLIGRPGRRNSRSLGHLKNSSTITCAMRMRESIVNG